MLSLDRNTPVGVGTCKQTLSEAATEGLFKYGEWISPKYKDPSIEP